MTPSEFMREYEQRLSGQDFSTIGPLLAEDAVFWFNDGSFCGISEIRGAFEKTFALIQDERYWLTNLQWIHDAEDSASCVYRFNWEGVIGGARSAGHGRGTTVLKRIGGEWKIAHEHLSKAPD